MTGAIKPGSRNASHSQ